MIVRDMLSRQEIEERKRMQDPPLPPPPSPLPPSLLLLPLPIFTPPLLCTSWTLSGEEYQHRTNPPGQGGTVIWYAWRGFQPSSSTQYSPLLHACSRLCEATQLRRRKTLSLHSHSYTYTAPSLNLHLLSTADFSLPFSLRTEAGVRRERDR